MVVRRKPHFKSIHPNRECFESALYANQGVAPLAQRPTKTIYDVDAMSKAISGSQAFGVTTALTLAGSRRLDEAILRATGLKIVPAVVGRIERVLLTVPSQFAGGRPFISGRRKRHYKALAKALGERRKYVIVCHPSCIDEIRRWFDQIAEIELEFVISPRFAFSIWAQDAYVALSGPGGQEVLLEGVLFPRYEDMTIADDVATQTNINVLQSGLYFQGGNILGGPDLTLIGRDYIWRNTTRFGLETAEKTIAAFQQTFDTDIVVLGNANVGAYDWYVEGILSGYGHQPLFHIDMYVTRTGVVGKSGKEIVLLGRPGMAKKIVNRYSELPEFDDPKIDTFFDATEIQLCEHFEVRHLPILLTGGALNGYGPTGEYYYLTFNNVVIERVEAGADRNGSVVMTTYSGDAKDFNTDAGLRRELEDASAEIWQSVGFNVNRMDGMEDLAWGLGSVHCISKCLRRNI